RSRGKSSKSSVELRRCSPEVGGRRHETTDNIASESGQSLQASGEESEPRIAAGVGPLGIKEADRTVTEYQAVETINAARIDSTWPQQRIRKSAKSFRSSVRSSTSSSREAICRRSTTPCGSRGTQRKTSTLSRKSSSTSAKTAYARWR